jgi:Protein of unknown function (DUF4238)
MVDVILPDFLISSLLMSKAGKHHFVPVFYLKQWAGADDQICEYKQRYHGVLPKRVFPDKTGYVHGLYSVPGLQKQDEQYVEKRFMSRIDNDAALALQWMLDETKPVGDLPDRMKVRWAQFVYSMTFRAPNVIERMQRTMDGQVAAGVLKQPEVPFTPAEVFPRMLTSRFAIGELVSMRWTVCTLDPPTNLLLTSDQPIIMTNGLMHAEGHIALPVSPRALFLAYRSDEFFREVSALSQQALAEIINDYVAKQAVNFVYAFDVSQTKFVQNRYGTRQRSTPLA